MSTFLGPQSVRDNCSFALDPCRTLRLEVSEVRLSSWESQKNCRKLENTSYLPLHNSPCNRSCTSILCMSTYLGPQSVRDNCSFALGPCRTLRLEVSEVKLSSWESQKHCRKRENNSYLPLHNSPCNRSCTSISCKCQHILALNQSGITVLSHWTHAGPSD